MFDNLRARWGGKARKDAVPSHARSTALSAAPAGFEKLESGAFRPTDPRDQDLLRMMQEATVGAELTLVTGAKLGCPPDGMVWFIKGDSIHIKSKSG